MRKLLTNFVLTTSTGALLAAGVAWGENSVPTNSPLPGSALQSPSTGPGNGDSVADTANGSSPMTSVADEAPGASSGNNVPNSPVTAASPKAGDLSSNAFARVHHVNQMEIEMGKLAMEKAQSKEVRAFAERLVRDHQVNDRKLMAFASSNNIPVERTAAMTPEDSAKDRAVSDQLHAATGADFDRIYLQKMAQGHSDTIDQISVAIDQLPNRSERNFLARIRPIISQHERLANILLSRKLS